MSENVSKQRLSKPLRFIKLVDGMREGKSFKAIADECGCSYKTTERDFWEWKSTGGFEKWVWTELMILHDRIVQDDKSVVHAYKGMIELVKKHIINKVEVGGVAGLILEWARNDGSQSNTALMMDNDSSTNQTTDSDASRAGADGAKQSQAQTKPSDKPSYAA